MAGGNPFYVEPANPLQALMLGVQGYDAAQKRTKQAEQEAAYREVGEAINSGGLNQSALGKLFGLGPSSAPMVTAAAALLKSGHDANSVYGTPIYGRGPDGKDVVFTFTKDGKMKVIDTGDITPAPGVKVLDTGTGFVPVNSRTGAVMGNGNAPSQIPGVAPTPGQVGPIPKDVQGEATAKRYGTEVGERQGDLGKAKAGLDSSLDSLGRLETFATRIKGDPNLGRITGLMGVLPNWPGGGAANAQAQLNTLKSQVAFTVLQAMRDASKTGGALGAVSDAEGKRLENNLAALEQAQDEKSFKRAMDDIVSWSKGARGRLQSAYDQDYGRIPAPQPAGASAQPQRAGANQPVRIPNGMSPQDVMKRLPSGTQIILPDGTPGVVP